MATRNRLQSRESPSVLILRIRSVAIVEPPPLGASCDARLRALQRVTVGLRNVLAQTGCLAKVRDRLGPLSDRIPRAATVQIVEPPVGRHNDRLAELADRCARPPKTLQ